MGEACGTEKSQTPIYRHQQRNRHREPGDANLLSASCPPSLEGQMLPWSQPDLWSEGKKKGGKGRSLGGGAAGSLVNTRSSLPSESYPTELGNFQRQLLLTSQLSWASGLLIRLVNTTRTAGGRDPPMSPATPSLHRSPLPVLLFSVLLEHLSLFVASVGLPVLGSLHSSRSLPRCLSPACLRLAPL